MEMNIDDLTVGQAKELASLFGGNHKKADQHSEQPYCLNQNYLIRTVTHIDIGTVIFVGDKEIVMIDVSWIADTGRYADALATGELNEVEPYPDGQLVIIGRASVIDATKWNHPLPREQK
jgi:acetoacetate decarboxylase